MSVDDFEILKDTWGCARSSRLCAIMGPSGAGKTSLLNVLAGRVSNKCKIEGRMSFGDQPVNSVDLTCSYVMQDDALMATQTPREAIMFSGLMRTPPPVDNTAIAEKVNSLVKELGLESCADTLIGNELIPGLSGGEKKRTAVGVELVTTPRILFLDEPTSGLDSYSAYQMIKLCKKMAIGGTVVLCTIHQPSSEIFFQFDDCIMMKSGKILYQGSTKLLGQYLEMRGCPCPAEHNPADHAMFVLQTETLEALEEKGFAATPPKDLTLPSDDCKVKSWAGTPSVVPSFGRQLYYLLFRELSNATRDKGSLIARFGITIFINLLVGLLFLDAGRKDDSIPSNFQTHAGCIVFVMISSMFGSIQGVLLMFPLERPMLLRERFAGTYSTVAYFLTKTLVDLPLLFLQGVVTFLVTYWLAGFQGNFFYMVVVFFLLGVAANGVALAVGCAVTTAKTIQEVAPLLFVPQILFAGFFVRSEQIPEFLRWAQYLCALKYSTSLMYIVEFDPSFDSCKTQDGNQTMNFCETFLDDNDVEMDLWYAYALAMIALAVLGRIVGVVVLEQKAKSYSY